MVSPVAKGQLLLVEDLLFSYFISTSGKKESFVSSMQSQLIMHLNRGHHHRNERALVFMGHAINTGRV